MEKQILRYQTQGVTLENTLRTDVSRLGHEARALIGEHIGGYQNVYLNFSGGKESVVLAHLCEPWRDRVSLVWVNTGYQASHMVEFIRAYGHRFRLIELEPKVEMISELWTPYGRPTDILPMHQGLYGKDSKWQAWTNCCIVMRNTPLGDFYSGRPVRPLAIAGVRLDDDGPDKGDRTERGEAFAKDKFSDYLLPLYEWTETDVMSFVELEGIELPEQYAEGVMSSLECVVCPKKMTRARLGYIERHYPQAGELIRETLQELIADVGVAADRMHQALQ